MIAVIKGDIIASRRIANQEQWLMPLKQLLSLWGNSPKEWELVWGDFFQIEVKNPYEVLNKALRIKALIKKVTPFDEGKKTSPIDVRMAIGIGEKSYSGETISESNGPAFILAGDKFDLLKRESINIGVKSNWGDFDEEINLYLKLAGVFMDKWTVSSAELVELVLAKPNTTQDKLGKLLGIKQSGVSGRYKRACADELLKIDRVFKKRLTTLLK